VNCNAMQDYGIVCPSTGSVFSLKDGSVLDWYPSNPVLRVVQPKSSKLPVRCCLIAARLTQLMLYNATPFCPLSSSRRASCRCALALASVLSDCHLRCCSEQPHAARRSAQIRQAACARRCICNAPVMAHRAGSGVLPMPCCASCSPSCSSYRCSIIRVCYAQMVLECVMHSCFWSSRPRAVSVRPSMHSFSKLVRACRSTPSR
jgi:hypothetical protein